jgi:3-methyladenine DNA glycosylase/8-oxoguanine DNA glycosylase
MLALVPTPLLPPPGWRLIATDRHPRTHALRVSLASDPFPWGAVVRRDEGGCWWRAEDGTAGPLMLGAVQDSREIVLRAWTPEGSEWAPDDARALAMGWAGLADDDDGFDEAAALHPVTRRLRAELGRVRLSRAPRFEEAFGRAVLGQLVQYREAQRSAAQLVRLAGTKVGPLRAWPLPSRSLGLADWDLRRCGVSLRGAAALRVAGRESARFAAAAGARDWGRLHARMTAVPGVAGWTSAETRLALGDGDAVPLGDWGLPALVGHALDAPDAAPADDARMLELLEPFRPHRGRILRLLMAASFSPGGPRPPRTSPRAALSLHRYW